MVEQKIVRTFRCKNVNAPGVLGKLTTAIGKTGALIGNITTVHSGQQFMVRDIDVVMDSEGEIQRIVEELSRYPEISIVQVRDEVLELHKAGKIKMVNTVPIETVADLNKVYTPGVAEVCALIKDQPDWKNIFTFIPYSVAIVTDGTAILGLGNIGAVAGMPVMEGKAALLHQLTGISGIPILLDTTNPDEIVDTVKRIAPTFGAIQLEDIASPNCFEIYERLERELPIPVMHDDQQGTAVVALAALINAGKISGVSLSEARIGLVGLGAAGLSIGKLILQYTGRPTLGVARSEESRRRHAEHGGIPSSFEDIMGTADVVIATSGVRGLIEPKMVRQGQIILALSNPYPEIAPELARASGAALAADGRSVNNLLGFPGIWRGTLDALASRITYQMYTAAAEAIAAATMEGELVPHPLDPKVHREVTHAVARAALASGVARRHLDADYFESQGIREPWT
ncbi:MAG: NAD-dependent malic enzyme [Chloroflexi bacterium]|nr:NAD-dependent malic enzyme [Chloroflexota bacterium]